MSDRPMLFSAPMVRALLDGTKTQTRRIAKFITEDAPDRFHAKNGDGGMAGMSESEVAVYAADYAPWSIGDRLWVKETWSHTGTGVWSTNDVHNARDGEAIYRATDDRLGAGWFPSIFMFRKLSRLTLTVTDVRVERLQDCSQQDAFAEGAQRVCLPDSVPLPSGVLTNNTYKTGYAVLWDSINGDGAWEKNPWVVALTFDVRKGNIDQ